MSEPGDFFENFFTTSNWPPRWYCGKWSDFHGWMYIISDVAIWAAYFTIPLLLIHFIIRKKDVPFPKIFWLFGSFIFLCGSTHLIDAIIFWYPIYHVSAFVRLLTALVSWATIIAIYRILPHAFSLKTPAELERVVSERTHELKVSVQQMKFLADAMPQIVWTSQPDGSVDYFNEQTLQFTGKPLNDLLAFKWRDIIHPDDIGAINTHWKQALTNLSIFELESRIRDANGRNIWHLIRARPDIDENGNILLWVGTATRIDEQKRAEEQLEKKVQERTEQLRLANEELAQSNADLEQFAGIASHDLKSPLRTVGLYLQRLAEFDLTAEQQKFISKALQVSERMKLLIDGLLTISRLSRTEPVLQKVDLNSLLITVLADIEDVRLQKNAHIRVAQLPIVLADELQIGQVFQNLIVNAIYYNENSTPTINVSVEDRGQFYEFQVSDNGIGMETEYLEKIFEVFTRLHNTRKGTGLGLSISKKIIEKMGGRIWVESEVGVGSTFKFTIPKVDL